MRKIIIIILLIPSIIFSTDIYSTDFLFGKKEKEYGELIEKLPEFNTIINWSKGLIITKAYYKIKKSYPNLQRFNSDMRNALNEELKNNLVKALGNLRVSSLFLLKDFYSTQDELRYQVISKIENGFYYPPVLEKNTYIGMANIYLYGKNGVATIFYNQIDSWNNTKYVIPTKTEYNEYFDSLIIDTILYPKFQPSLELRIFDEDGYLLYGPETIEKKYLIEKGVCQYTTSLSQAFESDRVGKRIYYMIPFGIKGKMHSDIIIHNSDAARLFSNPRSIKWLNKSRVVVVKPNLKK